MATRIEEVTYTAAPLWVRVAETIVATLLIPVVGLLLHPSDPLFYATGFAWLIAGPLLAGLRYGFLYGFGSALAMVVIMSVLPSLGSVPPVGAYVHLPLQYAAGVVLVGMVAGEFTDIWRRRFTQVQIISEYQSTRLSEFVRNYHLLRVSHDQLAERLAANPHNLRDSLLALAQRFHDVPAGQSILRARAADLLDFLAEEGRVQQGAIYAVDDKGAIDSDPLDVMGGQPASFDVSAHPMVKACLERRQMISLKSEMADDPQHVAQALLAVVPLIDVDSRVWAIVTISEMPFISFERGNLHLLAVLGANLGDVISEAQDRRPQDAQVAEVQFAGHTRRWVQYAKRYGLTSLMVAYEIPGTIAGISNEALSDLIFGQLRALDFAFTSDATDQTHVIFVLMPLTPEQGAIAYRERIVRMLRERYGVDADNSSLQFHQRVIDGKTSAEAIISDIQTTAQSHVVA